MLIEHGHELLENTEVKGGREDFALVLPLLVGAAMSLFYIVEPNLTLLTVHFRAKRPRNYSAVRLW